MKRTIRCVALLCAVLTLTGAACARVQGQPQPETSTQAQEDVLTTQAPASLPAITPDTSSPDDETQPSETQTQEASEPAQEITLEAGLNSTDVEQVLAFYRLAAAKNDVPQYTKTLELISLDGGEGKVASYVNVFEPIAKKAVAKNTVTGEMLPGKYETIRPEDWQSASAQSDGRYTTIRVQVVPQTDDANGKQFAGSVGRSMTVLDGVNQAVNEMPGVSADFANGEVTVAYLEPTITVKVDNQTGKFVPGSCKWHYRVLTTLKSLDAKVLAFNVHLQNAKGEVGYTISY